MILAFVLRFLQLGKIPNGHTNDEANYIYSAYSIWQTHRDLLDNYLPLSFNVFNSYSPVPIYLTAPFVGLFGLSSFSARLPFAIIGIVFVFVVYLFTKYLFRNSQIALLTALVIAISPWHLQLSKMVHAGSLALFFYTLGLYLFIKSLKTGRLYWSLIAFILAFYSYHGTKVFFVFFLPFILILFHQELKKREKELAIFIGGTFLVLLSFLYVSKKQNVTRQDVFIWTNLDKISIEVEQERLINTAPNPIKIIFSNKITTSLKIITRNYFEAFSLDYLFLYGEKGYNSEIYGLTSKYGHSARGPLYLIELPLLILGLIYLFQFNKKARNLIIGGLLIAPLPSAFTIDQTYGVRSIMMLLFLSIIVGCGIYQLNILIKKLPKKRFFSILFVSLYLLSVADYLYQFYFRYPVYSAESWLRSKKDISEYIGSQKDKYQNIYVANAGDLIIQYAIFNKIDPRLVQATYRQEMPKVIGNVYFIGDCLKTDKEPFDPNIHLPENTLYIAHESCHENSKVIPLKTIAEVGQPLHTIWRIYERK